MSVISGSIAAMTQADTANTQNNENRRQANVNALMQLIARGMPLDAATLHAAGMPLALARAMGGKGNSILPYYMGDAERNLGTGAANAAQTIQSLNGGAGGTASQVSDILSKYGEGDSANTIFANDLASGRMTDQMLAENQPVAEARMGVATGKRNAALESLKQTLNDIDAIQSKKGFSGDSMGNRMMKFNANRSIMGTAAGDIAGARFQNATDRAAIQQQGRNMQLQNIDLSGKLARDQAGRLNLPGQVAAQQFTNSTAPLSFFNLGPHAPGEYNPNQVAVPGALQVAATAAGAAGNSALNYYLQQRSQRQAGQPVNTNSGATVPTSDYTSSDYGNELSSGY